MDNYLNFNDFLKVSTILQIFLHRKLGSLNFKAHKILNKMSYQNMNICSHSRTHEAKINARKKIHMGDFTQPQQKSAGPGENPDFGAIWAGPSQTATFMLFWIYNIQVCKRSDTKKKC